MADIIKVVPAVLRIMRIQSDPIRLTILLILHGRGKRPIGLNELRGSLENEFVGREISNLKVLNYLVKMEQAGLVTKIAKSFYGLTLLGERSVRAFKDYESSLTSFWEALE